MSQRAEDGVVDQHLRVWDTKVCELQMRVSFQSVPRHRQWHLLAEILHQGRLSRPEDEIRHLQKHG